MNQSGNFFFNSFRNLNENWEVIKLDVTMS